MKLAVAVLAFWCASAFAVTQAEHDAIVKDVDVAVQKYVAAPPPPPAAPSALRVEMTDAATIAAGAGQGNMALPWAFNPEFLVEPTGFKYLRFSSDTGPRLLSWYLPFAPMTEAYFAHAVYIESDVKVGLNPAALGVKLPGLGNDNVPNQPELMSLRMEVGVTDPANPGSYPLKTYFYDAENAGVANPPTPFLGFIMHEGRWYWIEQRIKLNAPAAADGVLEVRVDGVLVYARSDVRFRSAAGSLLKTLHVNYYEGGNVPPLGLHHYRIGRLTVASASMPRPADLPAYAAPPPSAGGYPTWRINKAAGGLYTVPNTSNLGWQTTNSGTVNAWNGLAASSHELFSGAAGGHQDSGENKVLKLDLAADAPAWVTLHPGSSSFTSNGLYNPDGLPASRHTYFSSQFVGARNRVMNFTATATSPASVNAPVVDGFDLASNKWDAAGTWPNVPLYMPVASIATDPRTGDTYVGGNYKFAKWTASTGAWSTITPGGIGPWAWSWEFKGSFVDTKRNQWITLNGNLSRIDLASSAASTITVTGACAGNSEDYSSTVYDSTGDRYYTVRGTSLCSIDPDTGVSAVAASVPAAINGVNNRLAYLKDVDAVVYLPNFASNLMVFLPR